MFILDPFHDYVIVEALPEVMQRISLRDPDAPLERRIIMPDAIALGGMGADSGTNARANSGAVTSLLAGRVLWVGAGRVRDGLMQKPTCKAGDIVIFLPRTVSYEFLLHGRQVKLVPWHEIPSGAREVAADSAEWREFLALVESAVASEAQDVRTEAV